MPEAEHLPDDLKRLVRRQAEFVEFRTFDADVERLIKKLGIEARTKIVGVPDGEAAFLEAAKARLKAEEERKQHEVAQRQAEVEAKRQWESEMPFLPGPLPRTPFRGY
jgi:hypothetical protein